MVITNISEEQVSLIGVLNGRNLIINPGESSEEIIPNEKLLRILITKQGKVTIKTSNPAELSAISDLDSRAIQLINNTDE